MQTLINEMGMILNNRQIGIDIDDDIEDVPNHFIFGCRLENIEDDLNDATHSTDEALVPSANNSRIAKSRMCVHAHTGTLHVQTHTHGHISMHIQAQILIHILS